MTSTPPPDKQQACGQLLAQARERAGYSLEEASTRSHMQIKVLAALEQGDWAKLGAPVFVRGQLRSYARLLGLDAEALLAEADIAPVRPVELVSHEHTPGWERFFNQLGSKIVYVVMTVGLAIPVYMVATRSLVSPPQQARLEPALEGAELLPKPREPVVASMASLPKSAPSDMAFEFNGESWVQFYAPDGSTLEKGLMKPGERRQFAAGELGRVVIGNASEVRILRSGQPVDATPWLKSNVARFAVSSDGSPVASAD